MRLPPRSGLEAALEAGAEIVFVYRSREERERLRQALLRAARAAGLVAYTRSSDGVLTCRAHRDANPSAPPVPPRPHPYRPKDARAPSSRAFVEGGFGEREIAGPRRGEVRAAAELTARARISAEALRREVRRAS